MDEETKLGKKIGNEAYHSRLNLKNDLYFSHFKKFLDKNDNYKNTLIESEIPKGEKVKLDFVILGFLERLIKKVKTDLKLLNLNMKEAKWVIAAPSLWNNIGKNYLKDLANEAGMDNLLF